VSALTRQFKLMSGLSRNARLFLAVTAISALGNGILWLFLNLFILARGNDEAFLGLLMSLMSLSALVLGLPMGLLADRLSRKHGLLLGMTLSGAAIGWLLLAGADWLLLLAAGALGAGTALCMATAPAFMAENAAAEERATLFSLQSGVATFAAFAGSAAAGPLPRLLGGLMNAPAESAAAYRATLLIAVGAMAASVVPLLLVRESPRQRTTPADRSALSLRTLPLRLDVARLLLPELLLGLGAALLIPYLNIFFKQRFAITDSLLGLIFAASQLIVGCGTLAAPLLAERWGKIRTVVLTELASLPFLMALGFVPLLPVATAAFWLRGMLMNMGGPLYAAFAMEQAHEDERATVGVMLGLVWSVGEGVGPGISGLVQRSVGFTPLFLATAAIYLVSALCLQAFFGQKEKQPAPQPESLLAR